MTTIDDIRALKNVHTIQIHGCHNIIDVSALDNVHTLCINDCYNINKTTIYGLKKIHTLELTGMDYIDVNKLANLYSL